MSSTGAAPTKAAVNTNNHDAKSTTDISGELTLRLVQLKKLNDSTNGDGSSNSLLDKYDLMWDMEKLVERSSRAEVEKCSNEMINTIILNWITQGGSGTGQIPQGALLRVLIRNLTLFLKYERDMKSPINILKNLFTLLSSKASSEAKVAGIRSIGSIYKERAMQVASYLQDSITLLSKFIKLNDIQLRVEAIYCMRDIIDGVGFSGNFIHPEIFKNIRVCFEKSIDISSKIAAVEILVAISRTASNFSFIDTKQGSLFLCLKNFEEQNSSLRSNTALSLGKQLANAVIYELSASAKSKKSGTSQNVPLPSSTPQSTVWTLDAVANLLGSYFIKCGTKREIRAGISESYVVFLHEMKSSYIENNLEHIILHILSMLQYLSTINSSTNQISYNAPVDEIKHVQSCIAYILRYGLSENRSVGESGQQMMLKQMNSLLQKKQCLENEFMIISLLYEISYLAFVLGEAANSSIKDSLFKDTIPPLLTHSNSAVRAYAGICIRCLGTCVPAHLAIYLEEWVKKMKSDLLLLSQNLSTPQQNSKQLEKQYAINIEGYSSGICGMIASIRSLSLGIPNSVCLFAFETASSILFVANNYPSISSILLQSGWNIIGSLMRLGVSFVEPILKDLFNLWKVSLAANSITGDTLEIKSDKELFNFCGQRLFPLASLRSFIQNASSLVYSNSQVLNQVMSLLFPIINVFAGTNIETTLGHTHSYVTSVWGISTSGNSNSNFISSGGITWNSYSVIKAKQEIFQILSYLNTTSYSTSFVPLLRILGKDIIEAPFASISLKNALNKEDSILGPWRDLDSQQLMDEKLANIVPPLVVGNSPAILSNFATLIWEPGLENILSISTPEERDTIMKLIDVEVKTMANILAYQSDKVRQQIIEHFLNSFKSTSNTILGRFAQGNLLVVLLLLLKCLCSKTDSFNHSKVQMIPLAKGNSLHLIVEFLKTMMIDNALEFRRAAGESFGFLCELEGDAFTNEFVKFIISQMKKSRELVTGGNSGNINASQMQVISSIRTGCAFALGSIKRAVGGMRSSNAHLQAILSAFTDVLSDKSYFSNSFLSTASPSIILTGDNVFNNTNIMDHVWALHSLGLTIEAAGLTLVPLISKILGVISNILVNNSSYNSSSSISLQSSQSTANKTTISSNSEEYSWKSIGKVIHAIIHVLGPELKAKSTTMQRCNAIAYEFKYHSHPLVQLEYIQFLQSLILFAPHTVVQIIDDIVPYLRSQFSSSYLLLRSASVICLRQLVPISNGFSSTSSKDSPSNFSSQIEEHLFSLLDGERESNVRSEIQILITTLLDIQCYQSVNKWIQLLRKIVLSSARTKKAARNANAPSPPSGTTTTAKEQVTEVPTDIMSESENTTDNYSETSEERMLDNAQSNETDITSLSSAVGTFVGHARWPSKLFAMECLRRLMSQLANHKEKSSKYHFDLLLIEKELPLQSNTNDFLIQNLPDMVNMSFTCATSDIEALRPIGVYSMKDIVLYFANCADPEYKGHSILEQYQAQISSALRPAFSPEAPPSATAAACSVLVSYISSNIVRDSKELFRVFSLLSTPLLSFQDIKYPAYNEKATTGVKLAILSAIAQLYVYVFGPKSNDNNNTNTSLIIDSSNSNSSKLQEKLVPLVGKLKIYWSQLLEDYSILISQHHSNLRSSLDQKISFKKLKGNLFEYATVNDSDLYQFYNLAWPSVLFATSLVLTLNSSTEGSNKANESVPEKKEEQKESNSPQEENKGEVNETNNIPPPSSNNNIQEAKPLETNESKEEENRKLKEVIGISIYSISIFSSTSTTSNTPPTSANSTILVASPTTRRGTIGGGPAPIISQTPIPETRETDGHENKTNGMLRSISSSKHAGLTASLMSCTQLLSHKDSHLITSIFSDKIVKEIIEVILGMMETMDAVVQKESVQLVVGILTSLFSSSLPDDQILGEIEQIILFPIYKHFPFVFFPQDAQVDFGKSSSSPSSEVIDLLCVSFNALSSLFSVSHKSLLNQKQEEIHKKRKISTLSTSFYLLLRTASLTISSHNGKYEYAAPIASTAATVFVSLVKLVQDSDLEFDWNSIIQGSLLFIADALKQENNQDPMWYKGSIYLLQCLFGLLSLPSISLMDGSLNNVHLRCIDVLQRAILSRDISIQMTTVQSLRTFMQSGISGKSLKDLSLKYFQGLGGSIVLLLQAAGTSTKFRSQLTTEQVNVFSEMIRTLVYAQTLANASYQPALLSLLVASLIGILDNTRADTLHDLALQVLIKLASTNPEFKVQVAQLGETERTKLETALKIFAAASTQPQRSSSLTTTSKPAPLLKLDMSKYTDS